MPVDIRVTAPELVVRVTGWDVLWAMAREVRVPIAQVADVSVQPRTEVGRSLVLRMGGTGLPGMVKAGRYSWFGWTEFWVTRWPDRVLVVECVPKAKYDLIVLQVPDPDGDATYLRSVLGLS